MTLKSKTAKTKSGPAKEKLSKLKVNIVKHEAAGQKAIREDFEEKIGKISTLHKISVIDEEAQAEVSANPNKKPLTENAIQQSLRRKKRPGASSLAQPNPESARPPEAAAAAVIDLAHQQANPPAEPPTTVFQKAKEAKSLSLYKKIALMFLLLVVILFGLVFYTNLVKVKITIITNEEKISSNILFDVYQENTVPLESSENVKIFGDLGKITVTQEKSFATTGEKPISEEVKGTATIYNNYIKSQPLVASTRLLTPDNKLFRIKETVNVPAGGSVQVEIYADEPTEAMAIQPTKLTIPGLWAGLQDKIYAETAEPIQLTSEVKHYVVQADMDNASKDLRDSLVEKAKTEIESRNVEGDQLLYQLDEQSISISIANALGDETEELSGKATADVCFAAFKSADAENAIESKLTSSVPEEKQIMMYDKESIKYTLDKCDLEQGVANINSSFDGRVGVKGDSSIVDKQRILGLTRKQLEDYLAQIPEIASYNIVFQPSFIKRVPNLIDKIEVEISN